MNGIETQVPVLEKPEIKTKPREKKSGALPWLFPSDATLTPALIGNNAASGLFAAPAKSSMLLIGVIAAFFGLFILGTVFFSRDGQAWGTRTNSPFPLRNAGRKASAGASRTAEIAGGRISSLNYVSIDDQSGAAPGASSIGEFDSATRGENNGRAASNTASAAEQGDASASGERGDSSDAPGKNGGLDGGRDAAASAGGAAKSSEAMRGAMGQLYTARKENRTAIVSTQGSSESAGKTYDGENQISSAGGVPRLGETTPLSNNNLNEHIANTNGQEPPLPLAAPPPVGSGQNVTPWQNQVDGAEKALNTANQLETSGNAAVTAAAAALATMNLPAVAMYSAQAAEDFTGATKTASQGVGLLNQIPQQYGSNAGAGVSLVQQLTSIPGVLSKITPTNQGITSAAVNQNLASANVPTQIPGIATASLGFPAQSGSAGQEAGGAALGSAETFSAGQTSSGSSSSGAPAAIAALMPTASKSGAPAIQNQ